FSGATEVLFGDVAATSFVVNSSTSITATAPANFAGVGGVRVTTPSGQSAVVAGDQYTYTLASAPTVTALGTSSGTTGGGTSVTITGTNLLGTLGVSFGGLPAASFVINSSTSITAVSPAHV